ncbi:hypothetical protein CRG98_023745 [Punica granatum]|uniref:TOG domain-containing protein n=1 Tax=Punica granatum TaxID=22663 RepID=A0A2I0JHX6_PUNGR|nr:hypothetical protein CRG98_023745 [Punica granatum]
MGDQNKAVQSGAAMCMAKMVECAVDPPVAAFQKMCPRICKLLNNPNFLAKAALLPVVSNLSQVGAISPQNFDSLLQGIQECLGSPDWAIRKAAAETLSALAMHSSHLITDGATSTLTALEGSRFDKIKPVRDSMLEALQLWKKILGKGDGGTDDQKSVSQESENPEPQEISEKNDANPSVRKEPSGKDSSPTEDSASRAKAGNIPDKAVVLLKRKTPVLTDKELNPEFFQKLETRGSEALEDDNVGRERDPVWAAWTNAMDALHVGDIDTAYAEVLSTGDDLLLVKLMDRSGPTVDQLSNEVATEVLHAVAQFLQEQNLFDVCLSWIQQLFEMVLENGPNSVPLPTEVKKELLFNLHETSSAIDPPDDWEGAAPDQLLLQLASAWGIDLQQFDK